MKRSRSVFAVATCLALLGAAACESDPTTSCTFRLSEQVISVPVGESATVDNLSSCRIGDRPPVSWTARRPQIVRVTPTQDLRQARFEGVAVVCHCPGKRLN